MLIQERLFAQPFQQSKKCKSPHFFIGVLKLSRIRVKNFLIKMFLVLGLDCKWLHNQGDFLGKSQVLLYVWIKHINIIFQYIAPGLIVILDPAAFALFSFGFLVLILRFEHYCFLNQNWIRFLNNEILLAIFPPVCNGTLVAWWDI